MIMMKRLTLGTTGTGDFINAVTSNKAQVHAVIMLNKN